MNRVKQICIQFVVCPILQFYQSRACMCFLFHVLLVFPLKQTIALCCALFCIFEEEKNLLAITYFISLPTQTPSPSLVQYLFIPHILSFSRGAGTVNYPPETSVKLSLLEKKNKLKFNFVKKFKSC